MYSHHTLKTPRVTITMIIQTSTSIDDTLHLSCFLQFQVLSLDELEELVETIFASIDDQLIDSSGEVPRLKYGSVVGEFVAHPILEAYLTQQPI